ncbi:MAG: GNAT family N-acetyltransferase [Candidatus Thorarchaeota archaeon]
MVKYSQEGVKMSVTTKLDNSKLRMRPWDFEADYEDVIKLLDIVFEKELESKGLDVKVIFDEYKAMRPLMKFLGIFSKNFKHGFDGYIFENEKGEVIASVNIGYSLYYWEVAMVATHPDYRRQGLARQLVSTAIDHAKEFGAQLCVLEVLDVNEPAYKLYRSLGFVHFDSVTRLKLDLSKLSEFSLVDLPEEYELRKFDRSKKSNQSRYELDLRVTPEDVQVFHPVDKKRYFKPLLIRMIRPIARRLLKFSNFDWLIYCGENLVGHVSVLLGRGEGSPHRIELMLDPAHTHILSEPIIAHSLLSLNENTTDVENILVEFRSSETDQLETARKYGFIDIETMHLLGLKIEQ